MYLKSSIREIAFTERMNDMFVQMNTNPKRKSVGDCVIRALSIATDNDWDSVYLELMLIGYDMKDMPNSNEIWGTYLQDKGFSREIIPNTCPACYTIRDFANDHPRGTYVIGTGTHAVAVKDGSYFDTTDSGDEVPDYVWKKEV